jgi:NADH:ubiquinone oxidoreductase subunit 6 (subunit J)
MDNEDNKSIFEEWWFWLIVIIVVIVIILAIIGVVIATTKSAENGQPQTVKDDLAYNEEVSEKLGRPFTSTNLMTDQQAEEALANLQAES